MRLALITATVLFAFVQLAAAENAEALIRKPTHIPPEPLGIALQTLASQRGYQVVYVSDQVAHQRTRGASGELTVDEALTALLQDTGLTYRHVSDNGVSIVPLAGGHALPSSNSKSMAGKSPGQGKTIGKAGGSFSDRFRMAKTTRAERESVVSVAADRANQNELTRPELAEVIVTAQRRQQNVQDVPISMSVVTAGQIAARGLVGASDYLRGIPGVNQVETSYNGGESIVIRGIETSPSAQNFSSGPTFATYFGETPTTFTGGLNGGTNIDLKLVDIRRVEVLRGPQGTAFGDSSLGGAVRVIPVAPELSSLDGQAEAGYSNTAGYGGSNYEVHGFGNIPIVSGILAARLVGYVYKNSGYYRNHAGSNGSFIDGPAKQYGAQAFATDANNVGSNYTGGGRAEVLYQPTDSLRITLNYLSQRTEQDGVPLANSGIYDQTIFDVASDQVRRGQRGGFADSRIEIANPEVDYNLGWADLLATYSYTRSGSENAESYAYLGLNWAQSGWSDGNHSEHVGELRLIGHLSGPWNFLVGVFDEDVKDHALFTYSWFGSPTSDIVAPGVTGSVGTYTDRRDLKQKAAYGEVYWHFLQGFTLTGGARYYRYDRAVRVDETGPYFGGNSTTTNDGGASGVSPRATLSYKPSRDTMVYMAYSDGFRLGKPQPGLPLGVCDKNGDGTVDGTNTSMASTRNLNSDTVKSYEIGAKLGLLDHRMQVDADFFAMDWSGVPVRVQAPAPPVGCGLFYNANAGDARSTGVEFQAIYQIDSRWRTDLGWSWDHARLTQNVPALSAQAGDRLPGSPEFNGNFGAEYDFPLYSHRSFFRTDITYVGSVYGDLKESPAAEAGGYVKVDATWGVTVGDVNAFVYVDNLTDNDAYTFRGTSPGIPLYYGYRLRPRTVGVRASFDF